MHVIEDFNRNKKKKRENDYVITTFTVYNVLRNLLSELYRQFDVFKFFNK